MITNKEHNLIAYFEHICLRLFIPIKAINIKVECGILNKGKNMDDGKQGYLVLDEQQLSKNLSCCWILRS